MLLLSGGCSGSGASTRELPEEDLKELDHLLQRSKDFDAVKANAIDSLQKKLAHTPETTPLERIRLLTEISDQYYSFCSDSSIIFCYRAYVLSMRQNLSTQSVDIRIKLIQSLSASGIFGQAETLLHEMDSTKLSPEQKILWADAGRQLYSYLRGYLDEENYLAQVLTKDFESYDAYLREHLPADNNYRRFLDGEQLVRRGHNKVARARLDALLHNLSTSDKLYAKVAFQCAIASRNLGDDYNYGRYLTLSAKSDVVGSVKETLALPALAQWLYGKGDIDRAYRYINSSLHDATASNSRMRTVAIANFVPIIDNSYRHRISASRDELMVYFLLVACLLVTSGTLLVIFLRNLRRSNLIRNKLKAQAKMQENYIGHFLGLCASYTDKLESTRRLVSRKIAAGQTDELLKLMKSSRSGDDQPDDFFKIFDETFLDLYPDFIDKFNELLRPEERINYVKGTPLTTELRIYAFVRLGVQESVRIAQILRCSVSTIYTYRNRMRGRAINRDTFESRILSMGD